METPDFDAEFANAVAAWREKHRLREDDAVLLLLDLFRMHQRHWDAIRSRELPSFEPLRSNLAKLGHELRTVQAPMAKLSEQLEKQAGAQNQSGIPPTAAFIAALSAGLAGYLIGRLWL